MAQKGLGVALGSLLACEVDVIATHATLRGSNWRSLKSKVTGEFNYDGYVVAAAEQDPGYQQVEYVARIKSEECL